MSPRKVYSLLPSLVLAVVGAEASAATTMKAAVIAGGAVRIESVPVPQPASGQVRVKVHAVSVNPVDWKVADRAAASSRQVAGRDFSGVIDAVGEGAGKWKVGDAVIGIATSGSYAEYALASADAIAFKPKNMSFAEAAGLPVVAETAYRAMVTVGNVQKGQRVLIHGGAGGVGSLAVQIAEARGAHVIATASARNHEFLRSIGADETIDYNTTRFEEKVRDVDLVLNTVDADTGERSIGVIRKGGMFVSVVGAPPAGRCEAAGVRCSITGSVTGQMLPNVVDIANEGKLRVSIEQRMPLADASKAWDLNRKGHTRGKIILEVATET